MTVGKANKIQRIKQHQTRLFIERQFRPTFVAIKYVIVSTVEKAVACFILVKRFVINTIYLILVFPT